MQRRSFEIMNPDDVCDHCGSAVLCTPRVAGIVCSRECMAPMNIFFGIRSRKPEGHGSSHLSLRMTVSCILGFLATCCVVEEREEIQIPGLSRLSRGCGAGLWVVSKTFCRRDGIIRAV